MFSKKDKNKNLGISRNSFSASSDKNNSFSSDSSENKPRNAKATVVLSIAAAIVAFAAGLVVFLASTPEASIQSSRKFSFQELEQNHYNQFLVYSIPNFKEEEYQEIFTILQDKKADEIIQLMMEQQEMNFISFAFYYLANSYAAAGENEKALKYHEIAALHYLNPQSLLKLAEWHFFQTKSYALAYEYLHQSLEIKLEITMNNPMHPLAKGKEKAQYLLTELDKLGESGAFDKNAVREKLKAELPDMLRYLRGIYGLPTEPTNLEAQPQ